MNDAHYIDGRWQPSHGTERFDVVNAATEDVIATIPLGDADDANAAVAAAHAAFPGWAACPTPTTRSTWSRS